MIIIEIIKPVRTNYLDFGGGPSGALMLCNEVSRSRAFKIDDLYTDPIYSLQVLAVSFPHMKAILSYIA